MDRVPVISSNIRSIGFDPDTMTLEIEFNSGHVYQYYGVPDYEHDSLMSAVSKGTYFNAHIKHNYSQSRV
jgi:KTSC domain